MEPAPTNFSKKKAAFVGCLTGCLIIVCSVAMLGGVGAWLIMDPNSPISKPSAIACVCEWARLAPLPAPNSAVHVESKGSMFSREFIVTFTAKSKDISAWLHASPGTREYFESKTPSEWHRELTPGGGAQFAEITVSENGTKVVIRAYWS